MFQGLFCLASVVVVAHLFQQSFAVRRSVFSRGVTSADETTATAGSSAFAGNGSDVVWRQEMPEPAGWFGFVSAAMSSLRERVAHVVRLGADPQVGWIATWRVIAGMTDFAITRYWFVVRQLPRKAMRVEADPCSAMARVANREVAVAGNGSWAGPRPAGIRPRGSVNAIPEAIHVFSADIHCSILASA